MHVVSRLDWAPIVEDAAAWVGEQRFSVTLRQVFYHLVATQQIPNADSAYKRLSSLTAAARRVEEFPQLADGTREILHAAAYEDLSDYAGVAANRFSLDRTRDQDHQVVIGVEKRGMTTAAWEQFGARGFYVIAMGGYSSATIDLELAERLTDDGRPSVLLYAGDFDASGEDIHRNFTEHVDFDDVVKVALSLEQVDEYQLPINPGKDTDSRTPGFVRKYGASMQVEIDALPPSVLADLFDTAAAGYWDRSLYEEVIAEEQLLREAIVDALGAA